MKSFFRAMVALLLLPVCYGVFRSLWTLGQGFQQVPEGSFYFFLGFLGYLTFQWVFFKPMRTYVFGHEFTHAMAAWLTGGEVHHFKVSKKGGSVVVTKPNLFVALAPYMVPFYSFLAMCLYFGAGLFYDLSPYWNVFLGLLGATMGFHIALTFFALKQNQPDLKSGGKFLSGVLIFLGNAFAVVLLFGILFPRTVSWGVFLRGTRDHTLFLCRTLGVSGSYFLAQGKATLNGHPK
jgi:hypothetical protein